ncbi:MAG: PilZ domain-containing protein [Candidatus Omnitrophica bacterium]|nr:PilZ domain-containing protein [Candidatus Omnitrophota bacterium]
MKLNYKFLQDELALTEIRKHKWIESQKENREVGFATAAVDWIKKYGNDWLLHHKKLKTDDRFFAEQRKHRRFKQHLPIQIKVQDNFIFSRTIDINLLGLACRVPQSIPENEHTEVTINFPGQKQDGPRTRFQFKSKILRSTIVHDDLSPLTHQIFVPFNDQIRNYLRDNIHLLVAS